jgi:hypothetical protein
MTGDDHTITGHTSTPKNRVVFEPVRPASTAVYWDLVTCVFMESRNHQCV